ncbi:hypothetical protein [Terribacillus saccharophilus]|uniref:hypothetical protein n=1 Tax=Terribacillus saccharophilus TaxID=361277 RepID=UPI003982D335
MSIGHKFGAGFLLVSMFSLCMGFYFSDFFGIGTTNQLGDIWMSGAFVFALYMSPFIFIYGIFISWLISRKVTPADSGKRGLYIALHGLGGLPFAVWSLSSQSSAAFLFTAGLGAFLAMMFALMELGLGYITKKGRIGWLVLYVPFLAYLTVYIIGQVQSVPPPIEEAEYDEPGYSAKEAVEFVTQRHGQEENGGFPAETGKVEQWELFGEHFTRETIIENVPGEKETYYVTLMEKNLDRQEVYKTTYLTKENDMMLHDRISEQLEEG